MSEKYFVYDTVNIASAKVTEHDHDTFGSVTVFHDVPIAREIVQDYPDGKAYKPAKELEDAAWTAEGRWATVGGHPDTTILSTRGDINGRMINIRKTKSLKDVTTRRPMIRGILADLEVFNKKIAPETLENMRNGVLTDVSIGFFFDKDASPGTIDEDGHPLNGSSYDYVQRNLMIDHLAFGLEKGMGRCPFPACGIGADRKVMGDPFAGFEDWDDCMNHMTKPKSEGGQGYTKKQAEGTCGMLQEKYGKEDAEKWNSLSEEEKQKYIDKPSEVKPVDMKGKIEELFRVKIDEALSGIDDLVEEEYQGNAVWKTLAERAKSFFKISDEEWDALTDELKQEYIDKLPPEKKVYGKTNKDEVQWYEMLDWNEMGNTFYEIPEKFREAIYDAGLIDCDSCETIDAIEDASEEEKTAAKKRCAKHPISFKEGKGHVTKPSEYENVPEGQFADPCNFKYPLTEQYVKAAWSYMGQKKNQGAGGYSDKEWGWMKNRAKAAMKRHGHEVSEDTKKALDPDEVMRQYERAKQDKDYPTERL